MHGLAFKKNDTDADKLVGLLNMQCNIHRKVRLRFNERTKNWDLMHSDAVIASVPTEDVLFKATWEASYAPLTPAEIVPTHHLKHAYESNLPGIDGLLDQLMRIPRRIGTLQYKEHVTVKVCFLVAFFIWA